MTVLMCFCPKKACTRQKVSARTPTDPMIGIPRALKPSHAPLNASQWYTRPFQSKYPLISILAYSIINLALTNHRDIFHNARLCIVYVCGHDGRGNDPQLCERRPVARRRSEGPWSQL